MPRDSYCPWPTIDKIGGDRETGQGCEDVKQDKVQRYIEENLVQRREGLRLS